MNIFFPSFFRHQIFQLFLVPIVKTSLPISMEKWPHLHPLTKQPHLKFPPKWSVWALKRLKFQPRSPDSRTRCICSMSSSSWQPGWMPPRRLQSHWTILNLDQGKKKTLLRDTYHSLCVWIRIFRVIFDLIWLWSLCTLV